MVEPFANFAVALFPSELNELNLKGSFTMSRNTLYYTVGDRHGQFARQKCSDPKAVESCKAHIKEILAKATDDEEKADAPPLIYTVVLEELTAAFRTYQEHGITRPSISISRIFLRWLKSVPISEREQTAMLIRNDDEYKKHVCGYKTICRNTLNHRKKVNVDMNDEE